SDLVDGVTPAIIDTVAVQDSTSRQTEPRIGLFAPDPARLAGFGTITGRAGLHVSLDGLEPGSVYVDSRAAEKLRARSGDHIMVLAAGRVLRLQVADVVDAHGTGTDAGALL